MTLYAAIDLVLRTEEEATILEVGGFATYREAPFLRRSLFEAIDRAAHPYLIVDLAGVEAMDTASMAVLVEGLVATQENGPEMYLCAPSPSVRDIFRFVGLDDALAHCWGCRAEAERDIAEKNA